MHPEEWLVETMRSTTLNREEVKDHLSIFFRNVPHWLNMIHRCSNGNSMKDRTLKASTLEDLDIAAAYMKYAALCHLLWCDNE